MYSNVLLTRALTGGYKIVLPLVGSLTTDIRELLKPETSDIFTKRFSYDLGWWIGAAQKQGITIVSAEILLPPGGPYLHLEGPMKRIFAYHNIQMIISFGKTIDIPNMDIAENIDYIDTQLKELSTRSIEMN